MKADALAAARRLQKVPRIGLLTGHGHHRESREPMPFPSGRRLTSSSGYDYALQRGVQWGTTGDVPMVK